MTSIQKTSDWRSLETDPPNFNGTVLLFPRVNSDGHWYTVSNTCYARGGFAVEAGYTHWLAFELHPNELEMRLSYGK